ncbi:MAG TPA: ADP-ribosylglycohydrolase family protein [Kofleriaceae bacterium]|nr:ADP-ribosylglycohydrolase family protein [Kofleriaceae bacterium]
MHARLEGLLLGAAVGDALGLPREGLPPWRAARWSGGQLVHGWLGRRGMISDDTEHAALTVTALVRSGGEPDRFAREVARGLRGWFVALPPATGWATLRACVKLCLGWSPATSGVRSAGNGPLIRAPAIALFARDPDHRVALVRASTRVTHTDPRAEAAAQVIAAAAALAASGAPLGARTLDALAVAEPTIARVLDGVAGALDDPRRLAALGLERGASGYAPHTLAAVLWAWLRHPGDPGQAIAAVIALGGDTDSTAALVGALAGIRHGAAGLPPAWVDGVWDWPRSIAWLRRLARAATAGEALPRVPYPLALARNLVFLSIAVGHGVRHLLPPYGRRPRATSRPAPGP